MTITTNKIRIKNFTAATLMGLLLLSACGSDALRPYRQPFDPQNTQTPAGGDARTGVVSPGDFRNSGAPAGDANNTSAPGDTSLDTPTTVACERDSNCDATNLGFEFLLADAESIDGPFATPVEAAVCNSGTQASQIQLLGREGVVVSGWVPAGSCGNFALPSTHETGTYVGGSSFRLISTKPVSVQLFNVFNLDVLGSPAVSLVYPVHTLGRTYRVVSAAERPATATNSAHSSLLVFHGSDSPVAVTVETVAPTTAGPGIGALSAGQSVTITLEPYQILQLQSDGDEVDLTGTLVTSASDIAVWGFHEAPRIPTGVFATDHIQEQMTPIRNWGTHFFVPPSPGRHSYPDIIRVMAHTDQTSVRVPSGLIADFTLDAGQYRDFQTIDPVEISSSAPVMVLGYTVGAGFVADGTWGDPALYDVPPSNTWLNTYMFVVPPGYAINNVAVIKPVGVDLILDGQSVDTTSVNVGAGQEYVVVEVTAGSHTLRAADAFCAILVSFDTADGVASALGRRMHSLH